MTNNGVRNLPDLNDIMRMAREAQTKLMEAQQNLDKIEVEGVSGCGLVKIKASAKGRIIHVDIDESLLVASEKQMVEDLVAAAINDAAQKLEAATREKMAAVTGGMKLPPGLNLGL